MVARLRASSRACASARPTRRWASTRASSSLTRNGFAMKSAAPRPSAFTVASSGGIDDTMRTGRSWNCSSLFRRSSSCSPSTLGIMMSRSRSWGFSSSSLASRPSPPGTLTTS